MWDMDSSPGSGRPPGGGCGNPLQYPCLENPMDKGAWWATVHGVAKSRTRLQRLSTVMCSCVLRNRVSDIEGLLWSSFLNVLKDHGFSLWGYWSIDIFLLRPAYCWWVVVEVEREVGGWGRQSCDATALKRNLSYLYTYSEGAASATEQTSQGINLTLKSNSGFYPSRNLWCFPH